MNRTLELARNLDIHRGPLRTLQVNLGNLCNQRCLHCHVDAGPDGSAIMPRGVMDDVLRFLERTRDLVLDVTGGAPELNPDFDYLIQAARPLSREVIVRCNLTVLLEPGKEHLPDLLKEERMHLICSLPCYSRKNVDRQRGDGVFEKSIRVLRKLNRLGYGGGNGLLLDLVYNPLGPFLPPGQDELEAAYRNILGSEYGISFNRLITITNAPVKRFRDYLEASGKYEGYMNLLRENFNPDVLRHLMCINQLSVACDGTLFDCDFNVALGMVLRDGTGSPLTIDRIDASELPGGSVLTGEHCLSCTAGHGSGCQGALAQEECSGGACCSP